MSDSGAKKPSGVDAMNLASVQRIDPCAVSIVDKSTHTALYHFDSTIEKWAKTDVEGPLLVYKRADQPRHSLIIANRQSLSDHIQPITADLLLSLKTPYIFINRREAEISGIWFFERSDCFRIYELLNKLIAESREAAESPHENSVQISASDDSIATVDIFSLIPRPRGQHSNGVKAEGSYKAAAGGGTETTDMPVMLQKLLCEEAQMSKRQVYVRGVVSADQVERQLIRSSDPENRASDSIGRLAVGDPKLPPNFSSVSLGALSTTAVEGSETGTIPDEADSSACGKQSGCSEDTNPLPVTGLTKEQMLQAMDHLLKTDDDFVSRLHRAYVDSLNARLGI